MIKTAIFVIMTLTMMVTVAATTVSLQTHKIYAENKAKELCWEYNGEWNNGRCKIKDDEEKADYEDDLCDYPKDTKK